MLAIDDYRSQENASIRATSRAWGIPLTTLARRIRGGVGRRQGQADTQLLTPKQEDMLAEWVLEQEKLGHAPTHRRLREFAGEILKYSGKSGHIGNNWVSRFLQRHPEVHAKIGKANGSSSYSQHPSSALGCSIETASNRLKVDVNNGWTHDESDIGIDGSTNARVLGTSSKTRTSRRVSSEPRMGHY